MRVAASPPQTAVEAVSAGRITECTDYLSVDFGSADVAEITETYRSFADRCIGKPARHVLLEAGDNDPKGHGRLHDALAEMARAAVIPPDFKLALVASTVPVRAFYRQAQQALRSVGVNAWAFKSRAEAVAWLEGRSRGGPMTS